MIPRGIRLAGASNQKRSHPPTNKYSDIMIHGHTHVLFSSKENKIVWIYTSSDTPPHLYPSLID